MKKSEYLKNVQEAYDSGRIDADVYDAMCMNASIFCDDDEEEAPETDDSTYSDDFGTDYRARYEYDVAECVSQMAEDEERIVPVWNAYCTAHGDDSKQLLTFSDINEKHPLYQFSCVGDVVAMFESISEDSTYYTLNWDDKYVPVEDVFDVIDTDELTQAIIDNENDYGCDDLIGVIGEYQEAYLNEQKHDSTQRRKHL